MLVQLEQVVRRGDQSPLGPGGGSATSGEADEAAVVFGVAEDRLDQLRALLVELAAAFGGENRAHEVIGAAVPAGPHIGVLASAGVGGDQDGGPLAGAFVHLV